MYKPFIIAVIALPFLLFASGDPNIFVMASRPNATYKIGEKVVFKIAISGPGEQLYYQLNNCSDAFEPPKPVSEKDQVTVTAEKPGVIWLQVHHKGVKKNSKGQPVFGFAGAAVAPEKIEPAQNAPDDFKSFWDNELSAMRKNKLKITREELSASVLPANIRGWRLTIKQGNITSDGFLLIPTAARKASLPIIASFNGAGALTASLEQARKDAELNAIAFNLNFHGTNSIIHLNRQEIDKRRAELGNWRYANADSRIKFMAHDIILRCIMSIDYLKNLPEYNKKTLIVHGTSLGGAQALATAALDRDVTLCISNVTAMCDHFAYRKKRLPGWPWLMREHREAENTAGYFDMVNFAPHVSCEVIMSPGFIDRVCPPSSILAAYNQLGSKQKHLRPRIAGEHDISRMRAEGNAGANDNIWIETYLRKSGLVPLQSLRNNWKCGRANNNSVIIFNDNNTWGGIRASGLMVEANPATIIRKKFDLSKLPAEALLRSKHAVLRIQIGIWDYSIDKKGATVNGLNEKFAIIINGHELLFDTFDPRFPARGERLNGMPSDASSIGITSAGNAPRRQAFVDVPFPIDWIRKSGKMTVDIRKKASKYNDDFVSIGVDITAPNTDSSVSFDGGKSFKPMTPAQPAGMGEYLMRLILSDAAAEREVKLAPGASDISIGFSELNKNTFYAELRTGVFSPSAAITCRIQERSATPPIPRFTDRSGTVIAASVKRDGQSLTAVLPPGTRPYTLSLSGYSEIVHASLRYIPSFEQEQEDTDLAPAISAATGSRKKQSVLCRIDSEFATLENTALKATFRLKPRLELLSLNLAECAANAIRFPGNSALFRLKSGKAIFSAADAEVEKIEKLSNGFSATLTLPQLKAQVLFSVRLSDDEMRWSFSLDNIGQQPCRIAAAFPHIGGLALSKQTENDYYLFPWGGGTISHRNSMLRAVYGTNFSWWQMINVFSPERGGGLYMRVDDANGLYKGLALRKGVTPAAEHILQSTSTPGRDRTDQFTDALSPAPGIALCADYQYSTRKTGEPLVLPDAVFGTHSGDWRHAMSRYCAWSKSMWPQRKLPRKLAEIWNFHGGIGHGSFTAAQGRYNTSFLNKQEQLIELDSYWNVSDKAPWNTPWDEFDRINSDGRKRFCPNWLDPVSGKRVYTLNRGDYSGYNPQWGGLSALRKFIASIQQTKRPVLLYTDPVLVCSNTVNGDAAAAKYGVVNSDWQEEDRWPRTPKAPAVCNYYSFCVDLNVESYADEVASTMRRLCRDTGADGIRLDEYGHRGYICKATNHKHKFGEYGNNSWLQAVYMGVKKIRSKFDKDNPDLLLLTEFQGHDRLSSLLDGALSYDICRRIGPLAPVPVNLFRFYFPECKLFELNVNGPKNAADYQLWNGVGVYNNLYSVKYLQLLGKHSDAFNGHAEALIPSPKAKIYINKFASADGKKNIYTIFNATGFTHSGAVLALPSGTDHRYMDGKTETPLTAAQSPSGQKVISMRIQDRTCAVIVEYINK